MPIFIYNSLTRRKEELIPLDKRTLRIYACGVTVYDKCHIGHARSLYVFDVIRRYLTQYSGYQVKFVRNITDVDDKIINKGKELHKSFEDVVAENIAAYERDLVRLRVAAADVEPRATAYVPRIIDFILKLVDQGFAYEVDGNVYYNVRQFQGYGKLSGQSVDQMVEAARIENDPRKHDPLDFALWKKAKEGEKSWPSPWGAGRPGWHIECSCMSMHELDAETIDIHAGGRDLIFPHHENEIAQSEALTGKPFARYWIHHGLLTINGQKMAKSLGNFITVEEVLARFSSDVLKFLFLQSHYASPVDFSWGKMEEVKKAYERVAILMRKHDGVRVTGEDLQGDMYQEKLRAFRMFMDDDFNTPKALAVIFDAVNECHRLDGADGELLRGGMAFLREAARMFGIDFVRQSELSEDEKSMLEERAAARRDKDFRRSDILRDLLKEKGIIVEDTKSGQEWRR